ncbi:hypothetical protein [Trichothermofontia sp.]
MKISTAAICTLAALAAQEVVQDVTFAQRPQRGLAFASNGVRPQTSETPPTAKMKRVVVSAAPVAIARPEGLPVTPSTRATPSAGDPATVRQSSSAPQVQAYYPSANRRLVVRRRFRNLASPQVIAQTPGRPVHIAQQGASTTPISDRFGVRGTEPNAEAWRAGVKQRYGIPTVPTPITDRFGATGTEPNADAWRAAIKQRYGIRIR